MTKGKIAFQANAAPDEQTHNFLCSSASAGDTSLTMLFGRDRKVLPSLHTRGCQDALPVGHHTRV